MTTSKIQFHKKIIDSFLPVSPKKIIVFGSMARGDWDRESDIDLIIVYGTHRLFLDRLRDLYVLWDIPRAVDILAYTPEEFERMKKENLFLQEIMKEAEVIYER